MKTIDPSFELAVQGSTIPPAPSSSPVISPKAARAALTSNKGTDVPLSIQKIDVPKYTDLEDDQGFRFTVYNIKVTQSDGKVWTIGRRYNEVRGSSELLYGYTFCPCVDYLQLY